MKVVGLVVGVVVAALALLAGSASGAKVVKKTTCTFHLVGVSPPTAVRGEDFGTVSCKKVYGKGVQHDTYTTTTTSPTTGTVKGRYKDFFNKGTTHGKFNIAFSAAPTGVVTYTGTATIDGGTGKFKHSKGTAKVTCTSPDGGVHTNCVDKVKLTHL